MQIELAFDDKPIGFLNGSGQTVAELLELRERLAVELSDAIMAGETAKVLTLDGQIKSLEPKLFVARVENLKQTLESGDQRKAELADELEALRAEKASLNRRLARAIILTEKRGERVMRADFALSLAEQELESIRVGMRETREKLEQIKQNKITEVRAYETEFRNNF
jgi:chromosome segregation ATPase